MTQAMILHAIRRDEELRRDGHTAKKARAVLHNELKKDPHFQPLCAQKIYAEDDTEMEEEEILLEKQQAALFPRARRRGDRGKP